MHTCTCVICFVWKLKEWKLARVFIDYIEHWAQSQKASSFKFSNTVTASTLQRWCEPHYTAKLWTMREQEPPTRKDSPQVISLSSFPAAGSAKANHPIWPSGETHSAHTERLDFKGALSNCLYHMWLPNAFRILLIWLNQHHTSMSPLECQSNSLFRFSKWPKPKQLYVIAKTGVVPSKIPGVLWQRSWKESWHNFFHELKDTTRAKRRWILELHSTGGQRKETKGMSVLLCFSWICK